MNLDLTNDELLSTTRAVRKRLDLTRPVPPEVILECLKLAQQAPTGGYAENWHFVVVTDPEKKAGLADLWLNPITYVLIGLIITMRRYLESLPARTPVVAMPARRAAVPRRAFAR